MGIASNKPETEASVCSNADSKLKGIMKNISLWTYLKPSNVSISNNSLGYEKFKEIIRIFSSN